MKLRDWKLKLGGMVLVSVKEVRGRVGGSSLDSGGAGGLSEKECFPLDFYFSGTRLGPKAGQSRSYCHKNGTKRAGQDNDTVDRVGQTSNRLLSGYQLAYDSSLNLDTISQDKDSLKKEPPTFPPWLWLYHARFS